MQTELIILLLSVALGIVHMLVAAGASTLQRGVKWNTSSRDGIPAPLTGYAGRLDRSFQNFKETFPFFLAAIFLVIAAEDTNHLTEISAWLYFAARILYIPCYVFNVTGIRSIIWLLSLIGIGGILIQLVN